MMHVIGQTPPHPCAYIPGQLACDETRLVDVMDPSAWESYLQRGWRRSGHMIHKPKCPFCSMCRSLRVPLAEFEPNRTMRRITRRNTDLNIEMTQPGPSEERYQLYRRYLDKRHNGLMMGTRREYDLFLGCSPVDTHDIEYRLDDRLVAVGTVDCIPGGWSCVYCYFEPDLPERSLGTFNILTAAQWCLEQSGNTRMPYLYLGYWVDGSSSMDYKRRFRPNETLGPNGVWQRTEHKRSTDQDSSSAGGEVAEGAWVLGAIGESPSSSDLVIDSL